MTELDIAIIAGMLVRLGSYLDGAAGRGKLSWWHFHLVNWLRRDVVIVFLYLAADASLMVWGFSAIFHFFAHHALYKFGEERKSF